MEKERIRKKETYLATAHLAEAHLPAHRESAGYRFETEDEAVVFHLAPSSSVEHWGAPDPPPSLRRPGWKPPPPDVYKKMTAAAGALNPSLFLSLTLPCR
jgi:hypothetical protein